MVSKEITASGAKARRVLARAKRAKVMAALQEDNLRPWPSLTWMPLKRGEPTRKTTGPRVIYSDTN